MTHIVYDSRLKYPEAPYHQHTPSPDLEDFLSQPRRVLEPDSYLKNQQKRESNARSYPRRLPFALNRGQGIYVKDTQGQTYIDALAAAGTLALGHNHPETAEAVQRFMSSGIPMQTLDITTPVKDQFIESLFELLPGDVARQSKIQFCSPSGADAVEAAIKLAKIATGRDNIIAFSGAYHGMTQGTLQMMGNLGPKSAFSTTGSHVQFMPFPYSKRCPYGLGEKGVQASLNQLETLLTDPESGVTKPAALIIEAVQGEAGALPADLQWLKGIRAITQKHDIALILDEVQAGMGRTGETFAFDHAGIQPDIIVLSKALGGGLPMSVIVYHQDLDQWQPGAHAGTFRGNQLAMSCGQVVLKHLKEKQLKQHARNMGKILKQRLSAIDSPLIGDVRGLGLMLGVEIIDPESERDGLGNHSVDGKIASMIQQEALAQGTIVETGGRFGSTLRFLPPLIINEREVALLADIFADAVFKVQRARF